MLPRPASSAGRRRRAVRARLAAAAAAWGCAAAAASASAQTRTLEPVGTIPGPATTVHLDGSLAYVSDGPTVRIVDVADPAAPVVRGSYTFPQNVYCVRTAGSVAYAAVDFYGLGILDVSDPAAPALLGSFRTAGQALSVDVAASTSTAVVANRLSGVEVIDVSDPAAPVSRGEYFTEGYATDVITIGPFAYVADRPGGLTIIDLSKPGEPEAESVRGMTERPATVAAVRRDPAAPGATLAAVVSTDTLLEMFDVTDPSAPAPIGTYRHPDRPAAGRNIAAPRARFEGPLAFIADVHPPFLLQVVDLSDPSRPALAAAYAPSGPPRDVAVEGSLVLVAVGEGGDPSAAPGVLILRLGA